MSPTQSPPLPCLSFATAHIRQSQPAEPLLVRFRGAGMTSGCTRETPRRGSTGGSAVLCPDTRATLSPAASPSWLGFPGTSSSIRLNDLFLLFLFFLQGWFQFTPCCVLGWRGGSQRALVVVGWG